MALTKEEKKKLEEHFNNLLMLMTRFENALNGSESKEFNDMYDALFELMRYEQSLLESENELTSFEANVFKEKCTVAKNIADTYYKNASNNPGKETEMDANRMNIAKSLSSQADSAQKIVPNELPGLRVPKETYLDAIKTLFGELKDTDSRFSRDSDEYKAIGAQVDAIINHLNNTGSNDISFDYIQEQFKILSEKTAAYRDSHKDIKSLSDRQKKRLSVFDKFDSFSEFISGGDINPAHFEVYHGRKTGTIPERPDPIDEFETIPDEVVSEGDMKKFGDLMKQGPEYIKPNSIITEKLMKEGTIEELLDCREKNQDKLSKKEMQYLNKRIASEAFYDKLQKDRTAIKPSDPVIKEDGTIMLDNIHLDQAQTTGNGCYSCSFMLLLQSRGLNLSQEQIRGFRNPNASGNRVLGDNMGNIVDDVGGIATRCLPNTAVKEKTYLDTNRASKEEKAAIIEDLKKTIKDSLINQKSPVSLLKGKHYRTIVGYNEQKGTVMLKDSWYLNIHNPNHNFEVKIEDLLKTNKLTLTHLVNIDPANPTKEAEDIDVEYVNGKYVVGESDGTGIPKAAEPKDGASMVKYDALGGTFLVSTVLKMPKQLVFPSRMREAGDLGPTVKTTAESPEKQQLVENLKARMKEIFPEGTKVVMTNTKDPKDSAKMELTVISKDGSQVAENVDFKKLGEYVHCHKLIGNMDKLTPGQVKKISNALENNTLVENSTKTYNSSEFDKVMGLHYGKGEFTPESVLETYDTAENVWDNLIDEWNSKDLETLKQGVAAHKQSFEGRKPTLAEQIITGTMNSIIKEKEKALAQPTVEQSDPQMQSGI